MKFEEAIDYLLDEFHLGDYVYRVRERLEPEDFEHDKQSSWDTPKVKRFSEAVQALEAMRKESRA